MVARTLWVALGCFGLVWVALGWFGCKGFGVWGRMELGFRVRNYLLKNATLSTTRYAVLKSAPSEGFREGFWKGVSWCCNEDKFSPFCAGTVRDF